MTEGFDFAGVRARVVPGEPRAIALELEDRGGELVAQRYLTPAELAYIAGAITYLAGVQMDPEGIAEYLAGVRAAELDSMLARDSRSDTENRHGGEGG